MKYLMLIAASFLIGISANAQPSDEQLDLYRAEARQLLYDNDINFVWRYHSGSERIAVFGQDTSPKVVCTLVRGVEHISISHVWNVATGEIAICSTGETNIDDPKI